MNPAAKLITTFKINFRRPAKLRTVLQNGDRRHSAVEPYIQNVSFLCPLVRTTGFAYVTWRQEFTGLARVPGIARLTFEDVRDVIDDGWFGNRFSAFGAVEDRNGHSPNSLSRYTPIGSSFQHVAHTIDAPGRDPLDFFDLAQCRCPQRLMGGRPSVRKVLG